MNKTTKGFLKYCEIKTIDSTLKKIEGKIKVVDKFFKGEVNNLSIEDVREFLVFLSRKKYAVSTNNDFLKVFKRFLKWKYPDWEKRFEKLTDLKADSQDQRKLSKSDLLTPGEMEQIINNTDSIKYKTLLLFFQETACRPEEVLKLVWKDIDFNKKEVKLFSSKTGKMRFIPVQKTIDHLRRYRKECFSEEPRISERVFNISYFQLNSMLARVEKKLNFKKHLYIYLWRHSILTRMIKDLSPKVYEMYAGHSLETGMKIYAHLDNDDLRKELNDKIYNIEDLSSGKKEEYEERIKKLEEAITFILKNQKKFTDSLPPMLQ